MDTITRCLQCDRLGLRRGLCHPCYNRLCALVAVGQTTWAKLVEEGKALPAKPRRLGLATYREGS